jgi:hypothetical protein
MDDIKANIQALAVGNYIMQPTCSKREGDKSTPVGVRLFLLSYSCHHIDFERYGNVREIV